ncbi:MAG: hypothetical protein J6D28_01235 [Bacilli bacterium]|nr:hypothetical protein [Bacilli bacterium]
MKVYVDFDGVILDTDRVVLADFKRSGQLDRREFVRNYDWSILMDDNLIIKDSLNNIKNSKLDVSLLSRIGSIDEGFQKVKYLRSRGVLIDIVVVPTGIDKSDMVSSKGNILIDDKLYNLDKWSESGGISIFFNQNGGCEDFYGDINTKYPVISDLSLLINGDILKGLLRN